MSDPIKAADDLLRKHDAGRSGKDRGYAHGGKATTRYLPGALPNTWQRGDPEPTEAKQLDPWMKDGRGSERGTDGDDKATSPLEMMAVRDDAPGETTDPMQGKFRGPPWPDRKTDPYGWEMFFRGMMRASPWAMRQTAWTLANAMLGSSSVCRYCGDEFQQAETGRPREYCKDAHKVADARARRRRVTKLG
jgi:hypothetical protein